MKSKNTKRILRNIYERIIYECPTVPPETGGFIGEKDGVICSYVFDTGKEQENTGTYRPNEELLGAALQQWEQEGIELCGILHTHFCGQDKLSADDRKFIGMIMEANKDIMKRFLFPIVIPGQNIHLFQAELEEDELSVSRIKLTLIDDEN